jgi:hypothetical protein
MSVDVQAQTTIARSRDFVAEIMFDAKQDKSWLLGVTEVYLLTSGPLRKDSRIQRIGTLLSKHYDANIVVTRDEPGKMVEMAYNDPFEFTLRYELADADEGETRVRIRLRSAGETPYNMPATNLSNALREKLDGELARLKSYAENK